MGSRSGGSPAAILVPILDRPNRGFMSEQTAYRAKSSHLRGLLPSLSARRLEGGIFVVVTAGRTCKG